MVIIAVVMLLKPLFPVVNYVVNYDYIATVLCENKDDLTLQCNGKCHLMKELAKASDVEKPTSSDKKSSGKGEIELLFCEELRDVEFYTLNNNYKITLSNYKNLYSFLRSHYIFHPPLV